MSGGATTELVVAGWLVLLAAAMAARTRFMLFLRGNRKAYDLGKALQRVEPRQGVVTVVVVRVPGLEEALAEDARLAGVVLPSLFEPASVAAKRRGAELELPSPAGLVLYLGRFHPDPTHRTQGLQLALELQELLRDPVASLGLEPTALGVSTGEVSSLPFPIGSGTQVLALGEGLRRAHELARAAGSGEVLVDARRGYSDEGFVFEEVADAGAVRLVSRDDASVEGAEASEEAAGPETSGTPDRREPESTPEAAGDLSEGEAAPATPPGASGS